MSVLKQIRNLGTVGFLSMALVLSDCAFALGKEHHGFEFGTHGLYIIDFVLLVGVLTWFLIPRIRNKIMERHEMVKQKISEAKSIFEQAESRMMTAQERLKNLSDEINRTIQEFRELGEKERDALAHEGAILAQKIREEGDFRISQAVKMAKSEIAEVIIERAFSIVQKKLEGEVRMPVPDSLIERLVKTLVRTERKI